jgi:hypothetical protein
MVMRAFFLGQALVHRQAGKWLSEALNAKYFETKVEMRGVVGEHCSVPAELIICPECEGETFTIYFIEAHQHVQCERCFATFCGKAEACAAGIVQ